MKRIISIFILLFILTSCTPTEDERILVPATISGLDTITYFIGETLPDLLVGVEVEHNFYDLDLNLLTVESNQVNWDKEGVYVIFYRYEIPSGVVSRQSRLITVLNKGEQVITSYPVILNAKDITYYIGDEKPDYTLDITAFDFKDGILKTILIDDSEVDYDNVGIYKVSLSVKNNSGLETVVEINITILEKVAPLNVIYLNDFHGAILPSDSQIGLSSIGAYIESLEEDNTLFITGGDLLQGSVLSNYYYGEPIIEALNYLNHEAFTLGNHEFDWGIEEILKYKNENEDVLAQFNFLGTNIIDKNTNERPNHILPYEIFMRNGLKIGVIGAMGYGLESSIATSKISGYQFTDPVIAISNDAHILRSVYNVDLVIAVIHDGNNGTNQGLANLMGSSKVDIIFNGHTHQTYINTIISSDQRAVPVIQAGAYGQNIAHITINKASNGSLDFDTKMLNRNNTPSLYETSDAIDDIIEPYYLTIQSLIETELLPSGQYYSRGDLTTFIARLIADEVNADLGIHNYGGTRVSLDYLEPITVGKAYEILPFDNIIKTVMLKGSDINLLFSRFTPNEMYVRDNMTFLDNIYYKVATNDYVFDKVDYPFIYGDDIVNTGILIRDIFIDAVISQQNQNFFYINQYVSPLAFISEAYLERMSYGSFI